MSPITRTWLAFAAIGAALIHLALVIGSPLPLGVTLAGFGAAELGWGVLTLAKDHLVGANAARIVAIVPIVLWSLLVVAAILLDAAWLAEFLPLLPMAVATIFELFAASILSVHLRRRRGADDGAPVREMPSAGRYLLALTAGGLLVGGLTTPALAATEAGLHAQPHGGHGSGVVVPDHVGH